MGSGKICVFDLETIPEFRDPADVDRIAGLAKGKDPSTYAATHPGLCRVVAGAFLVIEKGKPDDMTVLYDSQLLDTDHAEVKEARDCDGVAELISQANVILGDCERIVTFNGLGFDIPVLLHQTIIHNAGSPAPVLKGAMKQKPWESGVHVDLMLRLSFGKQVKPYSLESWALAYGYENPKQSVHGGDMTDLVAEREGTRICSYVRGDVECTAAVWRRTTSLGL